MRRTSEQKGIEKIIQIGVRGLLNSPVSHMSALAAGNIVVTTQDLREMGAEQTMRMVPHGDCYVTIDIDLFDPSIAPGTGTPEPGGLNYDEMKALLVALAGRRDVTIRGFDLVEVNPLLDYNGTTFPGVTINLLARDCRGEPLLTLFPPSQTNRKRREPVVHINPVSSAPSKRRDTWESSRGFSAMKMALLGGPEARHFSGSDGHPWPCDIEMELMPVE